MESSVSPLWSRGVVDGIPPAGVHVDHYGYALLVAAIISLANIFVKPLLIIFTIPITILTMGLFLLGY